MASPGIWGAISGSINLIKQEAQFLEKMRRFLIDFGPLPAPKPSKMKLRFRCFWSYFWFFSNARFLLVQRVVGLFNYGW